MNMSGQLQTWAPAALPLGKGPVPILYEATWTTEPVWKF